jgi:uncharacterized protein (DUF488 family)
MMQGDVTTSSPAPTIWSIGHGARQAEELVATLRSARIATLVDVRTAPGSRRHPQFGQEALRSSLAKAGIAYSWEKDLGGFRKPRADSPHTALRNDAFRGYADHMDTAAFAEALDRLTTGASRQRTAFMCAETLWWNCHRRMLADALAVRGWQVVHLLDPDRSEPHQVHPALRVVGGRAVYEVDSEPGQGRLDGM